MKKEREITKKYMVEEYYCDVCGDKAEPYVCCVCNRHLCDKHTYHHYDKWGGDYADLYCYHCWNIGKKYREEIEKIESKCDDEKDKKNEEWYKEAIRDLKENKS